MQGEETLEGRIAAAEHARVSAEKAVKRAECKQEAADANIWAKGKLFERISSKCDKTHGAKMPTRKQQQQHTHWVRMLRKSHTELQDAIVAEKDAQIDELRARLAWRDAMLDELQLEIDLHLQNCEEK